MDVAIDTIAITLNVAQLRAVRESVEAGEYASIDEALCDDVGFWQSRRDKEAARLDVIRARIRPSLDDPRPSLTAKQVGSYIAEVSVDAKIFQIGNGS